MKKEKGHVYLIQHEHPHKETRSSVDCVCFHLVRRGHEFVLQVDDRHAPSHGVFDMGLCPERDERALVLNVDMVYATNDTGRNVELHLDLGFDPLVTATVESEHPDSTGRVRFIVPSQANGRVPLSEQRLYSPNVLNLGFNAISFVGLEGAILSARSWAPYAPSSSSGGGGGGGEEYEIFTMTDPIVVFMIENRAHFRWLQNDDIVVVAGQQLYRVRKRAVERMRSFFERSILGTREEE
jgi:hypothetical protein